jgi:hypothetical protein
MVYNRYSWKALEILIREGRGAFWRFSELLERHSEAQTGCPVTHSYTRRSIPKLLQGFVVDSITADHIFSFKISEYIQYRYVRVWYLRHLPAMMFRSMEKHLGWHLCVSAHFPTLEDSEARC